MYVWGSTTASEHTGHYVPFHPLPEERESHNVLYTEGELLVGPRGNLDLLPNTTRSWSFPGATPRPVDHVTELSSPQGGLQQRALTSRAWCRVDLGSNVGGDLSPILRHPHYLPVRQVGQHRQHRPPTPPRPWHRRSRPDHPTARWHHADRPPRQASTMRGLTGDRSGDYELSTTSRKVMCGGFRGL